MVVTWEIRLFTVSVQGDPATPVDSGYIYGLFNDTGIWSP